MPPAARAVENLAAEPRGAAEDWMPGGRECRSVNDADNPADHGYKGPVGTPAEQTMTLLRRRRARNRP